MPELPVPGRQESEQNRPPCGQPVPRTGRRGTGTTAGSLLADRYRLLTKVGAEPRAGAEFWRAQDTVLQRAVAVTVLRSPAPDRRSAGAGGAVQAGEMIARALRSGCFEHPGCARLLDVLAPGTAVMPADVLGAAIAEWVPGRSLSEAIGTGMIRPTAAARMVEQLAAAAEGAHRHGLVLGCDHPQRIRITPDGRALLAFMLPRPELRPADDVRGLGAVLYALLTARWPLARSDAARAGLAAAAPGESGVPVLPSALRPGVPVELDALITGTLGPEAAAGRVHTAAAVHRLLAEVIVEDDRAALFPPVRDGGAASPDDVWQDGDGPDRPPDPARKRKLAAGLSVLGVGMLLVFGYLGVQLGSAFGGPSAPRIVVAAPLSPTPTLAPTRAPQAGQVGSISAVPGTVEVYDQSGDKDNPGQISRIVDGDPATGWQTYTYLQPFPALKTGVGIMASFVGPVQLTSLSIVSPSAGTVVEIRSAAEIDTPLSDTVLVGEATLTAGTTAIALPDSQPTQHLLIWIIKLGGGGNRNVTEIDEVIYHRAQP